MATEIECTGCGASEWQEIAKRFTWQPLTLTRNESGEIEESEWESFDYGDEVEHLYYECRCCGKRLS